LVGNLFLILYFTNLPKNNALIEEEYEIEYAPEVPIEKEKLAKLSTEKTKIETHKAFNQAEDFIKEIENDRAENSNPVQDKLSEIDQAIGESSNNRKSLVQDKKTSIESKKTEIISKKETGNNSSKNSTNSYRLVNRKALFFPNPIYTCDAYGKVVLHIEVDASGKVIEATINTNSSTTNNVCLLESAISYAKKARFTKAENKALQMGSITYIFPGQD